MPVRKITRRQVEVRGSGVPGCLGLYTLSQTNKQTRVGAISSLVGRGHCAAGDPLPWDGKGLASFPCLSGNWGSVWNWRASCAVSERVSLSDMLGDGNPVQGVTACNLIRVGLLRTHRGSWSRGGQKEACSRTVDVLSAAAGTVTKSLSPGIECLKDCF